MNILQYQWSNSCPDLEESLRMMSDVQLYTEDRKIMDYDNDTCFMEYLDLLIEKYDINLCISFDFFPVISKVCNPKNIPYISWIYDSPHTTLYSKSLSNLCNYVFSFDKEQVSELRNQGIEQIYHQPLAVNTSRIEKMVKRFPYGGDKSFAEISFVGSLYQDNLYEQISYLPSAVKGYIDGICKAQSVLYGGSIVEELLYNDTISILREYVVLSMNEEYNIDYKTLFCENILKKYISSIERKSLITELGEKFEVALYSNQTFQKRGIDHRGVVDYRSQMPLVFRKSALNLNMSIRSIDTGIPLRCLDIMGAGGALISNFQPELVEFFEPDEEWICFGTKEELLDKVKFFLEHDDMRVKIAKKGCKKIKDCFTYQRAIDNMFDMVGVRK